MKTLFASTAVALACAAPAFADAHMSGPFMSGVETSALRGSELIGSRLYVSENEVGMDATLFDEWDDVGEISDIILGNSGEVDAVLADIGGFLGLGERTIAVNMDDLTFVMDDDGDESFIVLQASVAQLEGAPAFDNTFEAGRVRQTAAVDSQGTGLTTQSGAQNIVAGTPQIADTAEVVVDPIGTPSGDNAAEGLVTDSMVDGTQTAGGVIVDGTTTAETTIVTPRSTGLGMPMMEREGYQTVASDELSTDDLTGAAVYGLDDNRVGEIGELLMSDDGKLSEAIVDVGGFLGLGERPVAVSFENLQILRGESDMRVYIDATEEQLEGLPQYEN